MKHSTKTNRIISAALAIGFTFGSGLISAAQEQEKSSDKSSKRVYESGRDPFRKYEPPRAATKRAPSQVSVPSIQERIAQYRAQKVAAMNARMPAPKPTTALLLSEMQVVGISRSPRGYAAIVSATPINLSYVLYPGERFYDGQLVAIEDNRLIFRRETVFTDGHRERSVEVKVLKSPDSPTDMTTTPATGTAAAAATAEPEKKLEAASAQASKPE